MSDTKSFEQWCGMCDGFYNRINKEGACKYKPLCSNAWLASAEVSASRILELEKQIDAYADTCLTYEGRWHKAEDKIAELEEQVMDLTNGNYKRGIHTWQNLNELLKKANENTQWWTDKCFDDTNKIKDLQHQLDATREQLADAKDIIFKCECLCSATCNDDLGEKVEAWLVANKLSTNDQNTGQGE